MHLYTKLGQHERAVGLALELHTDTDRQLAADCASGKLWRKVGKYPLCVWGKYIFSLNLVLIQSPVVRTFLKISNASCG